MRTAQAGKPAGELAGGLNDENGIQSRPSCGDRDIWRNSFPFRGRACPGLLHGDDRDGEKTLIPLASIGAYEKTVATGTLSVTAFYPPLMEVTCTVTGFNGTPRTGGGGVIEFRVTSAGVTVLNSQEGPHRLNSGSVTGTFVMYRK